MYLSGHQLGQALGQLLQLDTLLLILPALPLSVP